ncbi:CrcB family protein [Agromyces protaetiae]|uniref:Fluoride-specific ion channel FluC n=1 Tax=Agromyces protaetiae TaxID=2509455 RepID=A0A4P6FFZ9_9MICO|nr:CrcB family protein [Agromyces protaetiae]
MSSRPATSRPAHLQWRLLGLVALGGVIGAGVREALTLVIPHLGVFPIAVFGINVTGAFILGALLEALAQRGPDEGRRRAVRLFVGTGVLGGYTTYSTLAVDTAQLLRADDWLWAAVYALGTVIVGAAASIAGILLVARSAGRAPERAAAGAHAGPETSALDDGEAA